MTPTTPVPDLATQWNTARRLYPIYFELAREFAIDAKPCAELEAGLDTPEKEVVEQANHWLDQMDELIQVHQLRQFLQTSASVTEEAIEGLLEHFLAKPHKTDVIRDKIDFLLVQYFSQLAPSGLTDAEVDLAYVAEALKTVLGAVELKPPVWLNALDRVLESSRRCKSLDELLHGGVLEQGRKAKSLAGDLFYLPVALAAFTRFGYLMRRSFFRLMLGDLNGILDGLTELEEKGVETIDCRRAQFSAQEPIIRLRVICQSWKVMFQAEYSSGQPLRMLVDLRASVEYALGRGKPPEPEVKGKEEAKAKAATAAKPVPAAKAAPAANPAPAVKPPAKPPVAAKPAAVAAKPAASAAAAGASKVPAKAVAPAAAAKPEAKPAEAPEFEVSGTPVWDSDSESAKNK
ncbi:MAG TPA: hypothetical protein VKF84_00230 [Candidatus Sulfotelmatobacter sp.]|nr:hypothetical protein [Candidatus Sulfotelmatobacter sp.]